VIHQPVAAQNTPVDIDPGRNQAFLVKLTPTEPICALDIQFAFNCANSRRAGARGGAHST
jgi:hypothetical protein